MAELEPEDWACWLAELVAVAGAAELELEADDSAGGWVLSEGLALGSAGWVGSVG